MVPIIIITTTTTTIIIVIIYLAILAIIFYPPYPFLLPVYLYFLLFNLSVILLNDHPPLLKSFLEKFLPFIFILLTIIIITTTTTAVAAAAVPVITSALRGYRIGFGTKW